MSEAVSPASNATSSWSLARDADGIAWLSFDRPGSSANVLSRSVLVELDERLLVGEPRADGLEVLGNGGGAAIWDLA